MKTIKKWLMVACTAIVTTGAGAQGMLGDIYGSVVEAENGETIPEVHIRAFRAGVMVAQTLSDLDGIFTMKGVPSGTYNLIISYIGKDTLEIAGVEVNADKITRRMNIALKDRNTLIGYELVEDIIPLIDPEEPSAQTVGYKQLRNNANIRDMNKLLSTLTTDIKTGIDGGDAYVRGSRSDASVYFVDGVKQRGNSRIPGAAIGKITVYTGGVPAKYGDTTGGVIIMETKSYLDLWNERQNR
jgi:hypothetical protein